MPAKRNVPIYSRRLRQAREAKGLSQRSLGIEAGIDEFVASTRVNRYETGVHQPDHQTLTHLAQVLDLPTAYFYAEDDRLAALIAEFHQIHLTSSRLIKGGKGGKGSKGDKGD
ncbi:helix-turn-helix domain-containing protein [Pseudoxanthomonas mexicana]|uniref:helix-turn-helix domain-containing protein n=1 Tax=Pseudoxanthomonas mexicana TaxID=128785 RepID=UPI00398A5457